MAALPLIFILGLILCCRYVKSQEPAKPAAPKEPKPQQIEVTAGTREVTSESQDEPAFVYVEQQALFQGGDLENFREWVQKNLVYPPEAKQKGIFGRVTVQFAVNSKGKICDIKILRGVDPVLDKETIRILGTSPDWVPARQGGKNVKQQFVMPVIFALGENGKNYQPVKPELVHATGLIEKEAQFQGGNIETFREWVQKNLVYPPEAISAKITGKVLVEFSVNTEGKVVNTNV